VPAHLEDIAVYLEVDGVGQDNKPKRWTGTGVSVLPGGWVITNRHVAPGDSRTANTIRAFFFSGTPRQFSAPADVVAVHPDRDLALLRCGMKQEVRALNWCDSVDVALADSVWAVGFPLGSFVTAEQGQPTITLVNGRVSALRRDQQQLLQWVDVAAPVAGGSSGSALVDDPGRLVGILAQRYEGFARAVPVEYVHELLGLATLDVSFNPSIAPESGGAVQLAVHPQGPAGRLRFGHAMILEDAARTSQLRASSDSGLTGVLAVPARLDGEESLPVLIRVVTDTGYSFRRAVRLNRTAEPKTPLRATIHSVLLKLTKAKGWRWDGADEPDPYCKIYVNGLLAAQSVVVRNQYRFLHATEFDCRNGDEVRIVVWDKDLVNDDLAGEIRFTASPELTVKHPTSGQIENCDITVRGIPPRPTKKR